MLELQIGLHHLLTFLKLATNSQRLLPLLLEGTFFLALLGQCCILALCIPNLRPQNRSKTLLALAEAPWDEGA